MNDFKNAYQSAVQDMDMPGMNKFHINAASCMDEGRHRRRMMKRVRRTATTTFSAMCVIFICGFGTVKAVEYIENVIRVDERGFTSGDVITMAENEVQGGQTYVIEDSVEKASIEEMNAKGLQAKKMQTEEIQAEEIQAEEIQAEEIPMNNYTSWEEFKKHEEIIFPQPSISIGEPIEATYITVCGDWAMVRYDVGGKLLWIERTDYADTQGHASSKVFPSGVCNEREYTTPAGYTYTLIDSVKEKENEQLQIHAAITVGSYEAYIDFMGYTEEEAKKIMDSIDLSVYE